MNIQAQAIMTATVATNNLKFLHTYKMHRALLKLTQDTDTMFHVKKNLQWTNWKDMLNPLKNNNDTITSNRRKNVYIFKLNEYTVKF